VAARVAPAREFHAVAPLGFRWHAVVEHFARRHRHVTIRFEVLRKRNEILQRPVRAEPRVQRVHTGRRRPQSGEEARPRRIAQRRLTVGVRERHPARRQPIDVRRPHLRVPAQRANPIVQVVRRDEEHVGVLALRRQRRGWDKQRREEERPDKNQEPNRGMTTRNQAGGQAPMAPLSIGSYCWHLATWFVTCFPRATARASPVGADVLGLRAAARAPDDHVRRPAQGALKLHVHRRTIDRALRRPARLSGRDDRFCFLLGVIPMRQSGLREIDVFGWTN
jgi:hypothetical protein